MDTQSQLIFDNSSQKTLWNNDNAFNKWCWKTWMSIDRKGNQIPHHVQKSTQDRSDLRLDTIKLLKEESVGEILEDVGFSDPQSPSK